MVRFHAAKHGQSGGLKKREDGMVFTSNKVVDSHKKEEDTGPGTSFQEHAMSSPRTALFAAVENRCMSGPSVP